MDNGFIAKPCNFQGIPGYMVKQYYNNTVIFSQFVAKSVYDDMELLKWLYQDIVFFVYIEKIPL